MGRPLDRFSPNGANLAGWEDLRCGAARGAIATLSPLTLRRATVAPATPAQPRNALHHPAACRGTTFFAAATAACCSIQSPICCASLWSQVRFVRSR